MSQILTNDFVSAAPKVLLTDTNRWALSARLAIALKEAGCRVSAICPAPSHALMKTRAVERIYRYHAFRPIESLEAAIEAADPDIVVPSCDRGVEHLHEIYALSKSRGAAGSNIATLIERSLGTPAGYSTVSSRYDLLMLAREEGVLAPPTKRINAKEDLNIWQQQGSLPWVMKADGTWGGVGVRVIRSAEEVEDSWKELSQIFRFSRAIKRVAVNRDSFLMRSWWKRLDRSIVAQSYIEGRPANCTAFAWKGRVLALIAVEVVRSEGTTGPASVVRVVENSDMRFAAERISSRLGLSGFFGLDFMIEHGSESAYLIEMNPRLTPPCYLRLGKGRDLVGALWSQLTGNPMEDRKPVTQSDLIAYQTPAQRGEGESSEDYFYDVPLGEPELIEELQNPFPDRTILFRLAQHFNRKPVTARFFETSTGSTGGNRGELKDRSSEASEDALKSTTANVHARPS